MVSPLQTAAIKFVRARQHRDARLPALTDFHLIPVAIPRAQIARQQSYVSTLFAVVSQDSGFSQSRSPFKSESLKAWRLSCMTSGISLRRGRRHDTSLAE